MPQQSKQNSRKDTVLFEIFSLAMLKRSDEHPKGTLLTIFTNIFAASLNHDIIVLCHDRRDWMYPERFIM